METEEILKKRFAELIQRIKIERLRIHNLSKELNNCIDEVEIISDEQDNITTELRRKGVLD